MKKIAAKAKIDVAFFINIKQDSYFLRDSEAFLRFMLDNKNYQLLKIFFKEDVVYFYEKEEKNKGPDESTVTPLYIRYKGKYHHVYTTKIDDSNSFFEFYSETVSNILFKKRIKHI